MSRAVALTTSDNPYDPITNFDEWERFDMLKRYFTSDYLARVCHTTTELGDEMYMNDIEKTIDEAVKLNLIALTNEGVSYKKVVHEV